MRPVSPVPTARLPSGIIASDQMYFSFGSKYGVTSPPRPILYTLPSGDVPANKSPEGESARALTFSSDVSAKTEPLPVASTLKMRPSVPVPR